MFNVEWNKKSIWCHTFASTHFVFHTTPLNNLPTNSNTMQWSQLYRSRCCKTVCKLPLYILQCAGGKAVQFSVQKKQFNIENIARYALYFRTHITLCSAEKPIVDCSIMASPPHQLAAVTPVAHYQAFLSTLPHCALNHLFYCGNTLFWHCLPIPV